MSLLLSDPSLCSSDFSRILYSSPSDWSLHADVVDAHVAGTGLKQHIEYKITITAIPRNSLAFDAKTYSLCPRFRELNRLWNQLLKIHKQLYLHGTYPAFAPSRLFGNTEPAVITERIDAIKRFFNFVFCSEVLRKSISLHRFFEGIEEVETVNGDRETVTAEVLQNEATVSTASEPEQLTEGSADEEFKKQTVVPGASDKQTPLETTSEAVSQLAEEGFAMDPSTSASGSITRSNSSCFLFDFPEANLQCKFQSDDSPHICIRGSRSSESLTVDNTEHSFVKSVFPRIANFAGKHIGHSETVGSNVTSHGVECSSANSTTSFERTSTGGPSQLSSGHTSSTALPALFPFTRSSPDGAEKNGSDYLNVAAQFISAAQKAESENAFELAFQCYKGAVKVLLQGVQVERDLPKRNRVRRKTAKYLLKAERLYRSHLSFDGSTFEAESWLSTAVQDPSLLAFQSPNTLLKAFRVVDILPSFNAKKRVFVVESSSHHEKQKYIMKLLQKSSLDRSLTDLSNKTIIPVDVPHMVQLHKFFETDSYVILLLEYLSYGKLWDFLNEYFEECQCQIEEALLSAENYAINSGACSEEVYKPSSSPTVPKSPSSKNNDIASNCNRNTASSRSHQTQDTYKGRRICFSVGDSEDARDLAVTEEATECPEKVISRHGYTAHRPFPTMEEGSCQLHLTFPTESPDNSLDDDTKVVEVEEAPAPVDLRNMTASNAGSPALTEALKRAKLNLQQRRCWDKYQLPEILIAYWMSQLCSAIYFLHSQGIIIRDLRPDNLLLSEDAELKLTFCSQWQSVAPCLDESAIDDLYAAPEVINLFVETTDAADRWSVGALTLELLCGRRLSEMCLHGFESMKELSIPEPVTLSFAARDLLSRLLVKDPEQRLSDDELRAHPFFEGTSEQQANAGLRK